MWTDLQQELTPKEKDVTVDAFNLDMRHQVHRDLDQDWQQHQASRGLCVRIFEWFAQLYVELF